MKVIVKLRVDFWRTILRIPRIPFADAIAHPTIGTQGAQNAHTIVYCVDMQPNEKNLYDDENAREQNGTFDAT